MKKVLFLLIILFAFIGCSFEIILDVDSAVAEEAAARTKNEKECRALENHYKGYKFRWNISWKSCQVTTPPFIN